MKKIHCFTAIICLSSVCAQPSVAEPYSHNLRVDPIFALFGGVAVDLEFRLSDKMSVGPQFGYIDTEFFGKLKAQSLGVHANFNVTGIALDSGIVISTAVDYLTSTLVDCQLVCDQDYEEDYKGFSYSAAINYQHYWNAYNGSIGVGTRYDDDGESGGFLGASIGLAF